jgi:hypothetical protein
MVKSLGLHKERGIPAPRPIPHLLANREKSPGEFSAGACSTGPKNITDHAETMRLAALEIDHYLHPALLI